MKRLILLLLLLMLACNEGGGCTPDQPPPNPPPIGGMCYAQEVVGDGNRIASQHSFQTDQDSVWVSPERRLSFTVNREKIDQDSVLVLFSTWGLLGLLKEYQAYCDTIHCEIKAIEKWMRPWSGWGDHRDSIKTVIVCGKYPELNDFINWLENVKLK